jgi:hypothetical protein
MWNRTAFFVWMFLVVAFGSGCMVHKRINYWEPYGPGSVTKSEGAPQNFHYTNSPGVRLLMRVTRTRRAIIAGSIADSNDVLYLSLHLSTNVTVQFTTNVLRIGTETNVWAQLAVPNWSEWRIGADGVGYLVEREFGEQLNGRTAVVKKYQGVKKEGSIGEYACYVKLPESIGTSFRVALPELKIGQKRCDPIVVAFTNKTDWVWYVEDLQ